MTPPLDLKQYAVLYVDDEEQALKYFPKLFGNELRCLTASSVTEARNVIAREGEAIGVVISDQRMPGASGVDLLAWLRQERPQVVRILTTAYSDLESAIAAVNSGAIFRYVIKPWEHREMFGILARAMEFHLVTRERDALLAEKISTMQRVALMDRRRGLAVLASGLGHRLRNPLAGLHAFLSASPNLPPSRVHDEEPWGLALSESRRLTGIAAALSMRLGAPGAARGAGTAPAYVPCPLEELLQPAYDEARAALGAKATLTVASGLPVIAVDRELVRTLMRILVAMALRAEEPASGLTISAAALATAQGGKAVRISIRGALGHWQAPQLERIYSSLVVGAPESPTDADLLAAELIVHHHCGTLTVQRQAPAGPGFVVDLPVDPSACPDQAPPGDWLDGLLSFQPEPSET